MVSSMAPLLAPPIAPPIAPTVVLTVGADITIDAGVPRGLRRAISDALTLDNPAYREAEEQGRSTRDIEPWLYYARGAPTGELVVPRGAGRLVQALCGEHGLACEVVDATHAVPPVVFDERVTLSEAQESAVGNL